MIASNDTASLEGIISSKKLPFNLSVVVEELIRSKKYNQAISLIPKCSFSDQASLCLYIFHENESSAQEIINLAFDSKNHFLLEELKKRTNSMEIVESIERKLATLKIK